MKNVSLGSVATIDRKGVDPASIDPATPYLGLEHIERGGRIIGRDTVGGAEIASTKFTFTPAHVLFGKLRPNLGKISRPDFAGICSTDILPIRPGDELDRNYLAHFLAQPGMVTYAASQASGANLPRLSPTFLAQFQIPLPPLPEQRRIATILDHADSLRTKRRQVLTHLDSLAEAVFLDVFGPPQLWSTHWPMGTIGDLASSVDYGTSGKAGDAGEWPILRMGNVTDDGRLDLADLKYIDLVPAEIPKYTVRRGDMVFNRTNSKEKVGKAAVIRTDEPLALAGYLVRVRFDDSASAEFVSAYLRSAHGQAVRKRLAKAAVNQANINATEMRRIAIAHPPELVRKSFQSILKSIYCQRADTERALDADNELFTSLQSRAFRGDL